ncbi:MAG: glycosyltransferase family 4 protein [Zetaproteobacteria bacterium]|nr:MAG: glycosyltransferase family 4 protein [Zetaproteobacteria bacterium]
MRASALVEHLLFALLLALLSAAGTWLMLHRVRIMDRPNARSSHRVPTPRGGGVAIVVTFLAGLSAIRLFGDSSQIHRHYFWAFLLSALLIAAISLYDDIKEKSFQIKLLTHVVAVAVAMAAGLTLDARTVPALQGHPVLAGAVTALWLVGMTNAYNFMDGIDGLAATTAIIAALFFAAITLSAGSNFAYLVSFVIAASAAGFLWFNRPPARIFMGDVGSAFLGFVLAALALMAASYDKAHTSFFVMPLLLLHFIFDTSFTMARRILAGENPTQAHRSHLYQLLVRMGRTHAQVTLLYGALGLLQGAAALWIPHLSGLQRLWPFVPFLLLYTVAAVALTRRARAAGLIP